VKKSFWSVCSVLFVLFCTSLPAKAEEYLGSDRSGHYFLRDYGWCSAHTKYCPQARHIYVRIFQNMERGQVGPHYSIHYSVDGKRFGALSYFLQVGGAVMNQDDTPKPMQSMQRNSAAYKAYLIAAQKLGVAPQPARSKKPVRGKNPPRKNVKPKR